ncbi:MAG: M23 family metallopeptidase [bacterium]|nr:M23 family metallopeptidase [bacterium]
MEKDVNIDTNPPKIRIISREHDLIQGGAGLVVYRVSEPCLRSGVRVGDSFYPGHAGYFKDKSIFLAFMALRYNQGQGTVIFAEAVDLAGNYAKVGFPYYIIKSNFKKDVIKISDKFLNLKMPEFATEIPQDLKMSPIDNFLFVNRDLRKTNSAGLKNFSKKTDKSILWEGLFLRLPRSARRAGFADYRIYKYKDRTIDYQVHFGIDLASVAKANVPAANNGKVAGTGVFGIYGKTVVIDHGQNLFSLYAHLSQIYVHEGQIVEKGDIIGRTGKTGFAAGDHLHFGMFINNTFINPGEWWDSVWVKKNILRKIENARRLSE